MSEPDLVPGPRPENPKLSRWESLAVFGIGVVLIGVILGWALTPGERGAIESDRPTDTSATAGRGGGYAGAATCAECHPAIHEFFHDSGHAETLWPAAQHPIAAWLNGRTAQDPDRPGSTWHYRVESRRLVAERVEQGRSERYVLDFALGSGRHAVTFLSVFPEGDGPPTGLEHRLTYFAHLHGLDVTPGQGASSADLPGRTAHGRELEPALTHKCLDCHSTRTSAADPARLDVATLIPNVTCERCHGPGQSHVEAARRGQTELRMLFGNDRATAAEEVRMCGACHRLAEMAPASEVRRDNPLLARFQPLAMMQSPCYTRSDGGLSCTTCHDPHTRTLADRPAYNAACLSCHEPMTETSRAKGHGPACPVAPESGCVDCHMPRVDAGHGLIFTDHWIRVRNEEDPPAVPADAPAS